MSDKKHFLVVLVSTFLIKGFLKNICTVKKNRGKVVAIFHACEILLRDAGRRAGQGGQNNEI